MKILHLSDTHGFNDRIHRLDCWIHAIIDEYKPDVLIHSGDFMRHAMKYRDLVEFFDWIKWFDVKHKIIVPGNHDMWCKNLEGNDYLRNVVVPRNIDLLINEELVISGVKFWGSPYTPAFENWGFQLYKEDGKDLWATIPDDVNVLVTHGPAHGVLDRIDGNSLLSRTVGPGSRDPHLGCPFLRDRIKELNNLKAHCFGHIHGGYGSDESNGYLSLNSAVLTEEYKVKNFPQVFELVHGKAKKIEIDSDKILSAI